MDVTGLATITDTQLDISWTGEFSATVRDGTAGEDQAITGVQETQSADVRETTKGGEIKGFRIAKRMRSLTINFFPTANTSSGGLNKALIGMELPKMPSKVTITNAKATTGTDVIKINGDWIYLQGAQRIFSEDVAGLTLPLVQYINADGTTTNVDATTLLTAVT